jgi:hypothetical protein
MTLHRNILDVPEVPNYPNHILFGNGDKCLQIRNFLQHRGTFSRIKIFIPYFGKGLVWGKLKMLNGTPCHSTHLLKSNM